MNRHPLTLVVAACGLVSAAGCGSTAAPGTSSPATTARVSAPPSATPQLAGTTRTVLTQLGLNIHADASATSAVLGVAGQAAQLAVLDYRSTGGGWFKVQGATVTGWITADPALSAAGTFTSYSSTARGFSVLYPSDWTFAESQADVTFRPQQQDQRTIVVRTAATTAAFGQQASPGYTASFNKQLIVCGYTGILVEYQRASGTPVSTAGTAPGSPQLAYYAVVRLTFDPGHAMQLLYNYDKPAQLDVFDDFYNSISFPYPLCQAPQTPAPSPS